MSAPRWGHHWSRSTIEQACASIGLPLHIYGGPFWHHTMQQILLEKLAAGADWVLCFDHDTCLRKNDLIQLLQHAIEHDVDALAATQVRRSDKAVIMSRARKTDTDYLLEADTAHFGCTILKCSALANVPLPWFWELPNIEGCWSKKAHQLKVHPFMQRVADEVGNVFAVDADIWFWKQWKAAGNSLFVDLSLPIGHVEEMVSEMQPDGTVSHRSVNDWGYDL